MREDGVMVDSLLITSNEEYNPNLSEVLETIENCYGSNLTFFTDLTFTEDQGLIIIEAEDYSDCEYGSDIAEGTNWTLESNFSNYTGQGYMESSPDVKVKTGDTTFGPHLKYNLSLPNTGSYHIWIRMSGSRWRRRLDSCRLKWNSINIRRGWAIYSTKCILELGDDYC